MARIGEQPIDDAAPFVRTLVAEERMDVGGEWDPAGDVEVGASQKLGVVRLRSRANVVGAKDAFEVTIDALGQRIRIGRLGGRGTRRQQGNQNRGWRSHGYSGRTWRQISSRSSRR